MNQMLPLFKKEFIESWRNFKFAAILIVFAIIGILSPFTALILPDILGMVMDDSGVTVDIPESTSLDSYMQFFSNMNQMGLVIFVIVFGSILTHEFTHNTLVNLVTKGLKRTYVIVVKASFLMLVWTVGYVISASVAYAYTIYYWDEPVEHLVLAFSMTAALSTPTANCWAAFGSSVTIASVCPEPKRLICFTASWSELMTQIEMIGPKNSAPKSSSLAGRANSINSQQRWSPRISISFSCKAMASAGKNSLATSAWTSRDSAALQTPIRWHLELMVIAIAIFKSAAASTYTWQLPWKCLITGICASAATRRISPSPPRGMARSMHSGKCRKCPTASRSVVLTS